MKKSIILEGPNGCGKSTLGERLQKDLSLPLSHSGPNPGDTIKAAEACLKQLKKMHEGYIIDRVTPISRVVYDHDVIPTVETVFFNIVLEKMINNAVVIYCTHRGEFTNKDYYPSGHFDKIVFERDLIYNLYADLMQGIPHISYDWENDSYEDLLGVLSE